MSDRPPRETVRQETTLAPWLLAIAATAVGVAIQVHDGEYEPTIGGAVSIGLITLAILAAATAIIMPLRENPLPNPPPAYRGREQDCGTVLCMLLAIQFAILLLSRPDSWEHSYLQPGGLESLKFYRAGAALAAAVAALMGIMALGHLSKRLPSAPGSVLTLLVFAQLLVFTSLAGWCLKWTSVRGSDTHPHIDVFVFQQQAARALLHERNPYAIDDFPDIYADPTGKPRQEVYGPGMSDGRVLHFGFPYLPASLYLATLGYAAAGDHRAAQVAALVLSALLIYRSRSGRAAASALAACLLLSTPRVFFILISGWTEPFLVLWMSAAVYCACRRPRLLPIALGLLLATKQYMALAVLPASILLVPRDAGMAGWRRILPRWGDWIKLLALAAAVAFVVTAPLALWDWKRFYHSVVTVQLYAPFRWDAMSYLTWHAHGHGEPSAASTRVLPAVAAAAAIALSLWRAPRTPAGFAAAVGLILLVFFAFSKQAFANYYFFVIGALCCAVAASGGAIAPALHHSESASPPAPLRRRAL